MAISTPLETNPWFTLDLGRHGRSIFVDWLSYPRAQVTAVSRCPEGHRAFFRVTVGTVMCPTCRSLINSAGVWVQGGGTTPEWQA
jgi:hypothetical protein